MKDNSLIEGGILVLNLGGNLAQYYAKNTKDECIFKHIVRRKGRDRRN